MKLNSRLKIVRQLYTADERPWVVAFSGGKDSTALLLLLWLALHDLDARIRSKPVFVSYVDTGMEHPLYAERIRSVLRDIQAASIRQGMPFTVQVLEPELRHRFFVAVVGRGYAPPTHWFRWCTKGMRIRPMTQFIRARLSESGQVVVALGLRRSESQSREQILARYQSKNPFIGRYGSIGSATAFTPIEDFSIEEVWQFLMQCPCPWDNNNRELVQLYSIAAGGECPSYSLGDGLAPSCGGSRFGCWTCTVVRKDRSGEGLASWDDSFERLIEFRNWLVEMRYDPHRRWKRRRNGAPGPGPLRLGTRKEVLARLLFAEQATSYTLIAPQEIDAIQRHWNEDGDKKNTAVSLYEQHSKRKALPPLHLR